MSDTDDMPLDGEADLTPIERQRLRKLIRDDDRATWARKQLRIFVPIGIAVATGVWQAIDWVVKHVKVNP